MSWWTPFDSLDEMFSVALAYCCDRSKEKTVSAQFRTIRTIEVGATFSAAIVVDPTVPRAVDSLKIKGRLLNPPPDQTGRAVSLLFHKGNKWADSITDHLKWSTNFGKTCLWAKRKGTAETVPLQTAVN